MGKATVLTTVLAFFFLVAGAGSSMSSMAKFGKEALVFSFCNSSNSLDLCGSSSRDTGFPPFASHMLPGGVSLDLCLEPAGQLSCGFFTPVETHSYGGLHIRELQRKLIGNGAHRELTSLVSVTLEKSRICHMVVVERLSSGVFADMFELEGLVARRAYESAVIYGDHNLELPALHSSESMVVLQTSFRSHSEEPFQVEITLPLHARYPALSQESHATIDLKCPYFLFQCVHEVDNASAATMKTSKQGSRWALLAMRESSSLDHVVLQWHVPAGNPLHTGVVATITATTSLVGVMILWIVSKLSYDQQGQN